MGRIIWNTEVNAPCCPGEIINCDNENERILIQTDWDYPGVASSFGWSIRDVQDVTEHSMCRANCVNYDANNGCDDDEFCKGCEEFELAEEEHCDHDGTDGTVDCKDCGLTADVFMSAAYDWLVKHDGAEVEDPGYFE